ncbi:hypothetical protein [Sabulicella glaciei]|uniref:Uncharacterized protein n=1 Tax=Sabulicella glaciei TaxID=2984948 RepID=A0ABT3NWE7_9PROT|nr:hypothetical protein [Roseococcus sp. MDT2-1-1]MCW8086479.1 hypothetical protein [Roseococcus sp. MDT2-1-1]
MTRSPRRRKLKPETVREVLEAAEDFRGLCNQVLRETAPESIHYQKARQAMEAVDHLALGMVAEREHRHLRSYALH